MLLLILLTKNFILKFILFLPTHSLQLFFLPYRQQTVSLNPSVTPVLSHRPLPHPFLSSTTHFQIPYQGLGTRTHPAALTVDTTDVHSLCIFYCEFKQPLSVSESDPLHSRYISCLSTTTKTQLPSFTHGISSECFCSLFSSVPPARDQRQLGLLSFSPPESCFWVVFSAIINSALLSGLKHRVVFFYSKPTDQVVTISRYEMFWVIHDTFMGFFF